MLSSIGNNEEAPSLSTPNSAFEPEDTDRPSEDLPLRREGTAKASMAQPSSQPQKRKADDAVPRANGKVLKTSQNGGPTSVAQNSTTSQRPSTGDNTMKTSTTSTLKVPYRGTSRPSAPEGTLPGKALPKELKRPAVTTTSSLQPGANRSPITSTPTTTAPSTPAAEGTKVPKKGSYAEIMARAKALQNNPPVGVIKHQPKDKKVLSDKKELLLQKKGLAGKPKNSTPGGHSRNSSGDVSGGSRPGSSGKQEGPVKKKGPEIAYKGTAKPKPQPTYKGTMKPAPAANIPLHKKPTTMQDDRRRSNPLVKSPAAKGRRPVYSDEEDEEDEEEEEEDYESESDMEAGYSDVEEEETKATRIAKKEDEFEAKMEAEMKRQKEARKRREAELARNQRRNQY